MKTEHTIEDLAAELKATRDTLETLIVWLVLELGEKAVDKLLLKLSGEAGGDGQNRKIAAYNRSVDGTGKPRI